MCIVDEVGETEAKVRPVAQPHTYVRIQLSAIHIVYPAAFVAAEEVFFK